LLTKYVVMYRLVVVEANMHTADNLYPWQIIIQFVKPWILFSPQMSKYIEKIQMFYFSVILYIQIFYLNLQLRLGSKD
jgi:hypothetical protein